MPSVTDLTMFIVQDTKHSVAIATHESYKKSFLVLWRRKTMPYSCAVKTKNDGLTFMDDAVVELCLNE